MGGVERFRHLGQQRQRLGWGHAPFAVEPCAERLAIQKLHGQEDRGIGRGGAGGMTRQVKHAANVGMGDLARELDFLLESRQHAAVGGDDR